jgi:hypothetical protein
MPLNSVVALAGVTVVAGGVVCYLLGRRWWGDIPFLWATRDIRPAAPPYSSRFLEYPAVVGTSLWLVSYLAKSAVSTYGVFLGIAAALAAATAATLHRVNPKGAVLWAASPLLAVYGGHNFELMAIAPSTMALVGIEGGASFGPGILLAVGTWAKLYPIVFLACGIVFLLVTGQGRRTMPLLLGFAVATAAFNAIYIIDSFGGWSEAFRFHGRRTPTWGTLWFYAFHDTHMNLHLSVSDTLRVINLLSPVVAGVGSLWFWCPSPAVGAVSTNTLAWP